jgi:hypothetical protein
MAAWKPWPTATSQPHAVRSRALARPSRARVDDVVSDDVAPLGLADGFTIR